MRTNKKNHPSPLVNGKAKAKFKQLLPIVGNSFKILLSIFLHVALFLWVVYCVNVGVTTEKQGIIQAVILANLVVSCILVNLTIKNSKQLTDEQRNGKGD